MSQLDSNDVAMGCPCTASVTVVKFTTNKLLLFLYPNESGIRTLYSFNLDTNELQPLLDASSESASDVNTLSLTEQLRRERMRNFSNGIVTFEVVEFPSVFENRLMIPTSDGKISIYDHSESFVPKLWTAYDGCKGRAVDPHISSIGDKVAFVIDDDIYYVRVVDNHTSETVHRVTALGSQPGVACGVAEFVAQEEMDRYRGFWWSPVPVAGPQKLLFTVTDETNIPEFAISHAVSVDPHEGERHRYPFAGRANVSVRLAVVNIVDNQDEALPSPRFLAIGASAWEAAVGAGSSSSEYYLARAGWWPDGSAMAQVMSRDQTLLQLLRLDVDSGKRTVLAEERCGAESKWLNLHDMLHCLPLGWCTPTHAAAAPSTGHFHFIWASSRSGFCQLYLYKYDAASNECVCLNGGASVSASGGAAWVVDSIDGVDDDGGVVYFSASADKCSEKHLYRNSLHSPSHSPQKLTAGAGWHQSVVSCANGIAAVSHSSLVQSPVFALYKLPALDDTSVVTLTRELCKAVPSSSHETTLISSLVVPEFMTVPSSVGDAAPVPLECCVYRPNAAVHGVGPHPAIVAVYGGPCVQRVLNHWTTRGDLRAQRFAQMGFLVIKCDNRGTSRRGCAFENDIWLNMGDVEVKDQCAAVKHLADMGLVDTANVGIYGWSYGGYLSAMALCKAPSVFKCACAGAPVTFWEGYDTFYTERYMSTPEKNAEGYTNSSVMTHASALVGKLLIIHGLIDENVHFRHSAFLIEKLNSLRKRYELLLFPNERHSPHKLSDKVYTEDRILDFFKSYLEMPQGRQNVAHTMMHNSVDNSSVGSNGERIYAHL